MLKRGGVAVGVVVMTVLAMAALLTAAARVPEAENEEKVAVKDLPRNVLAVVKAVCPGGKILSAEKETDRKTGQVEYDVKVRQEGGKVVEVEVVLDKAGNVRKVQVGEDDDDKEDAEDDD